MRASRVNYFILPLALLFCFLLFKNISYPLLWNDESETVMTAKHILRFAYPKMHDEKNFIFIPDIGTGPQWIGYKPSYDANITMPWGNYYFATIGVYLADHVEDIFLKGAIIRSTFAVMGLIGLAIFLFALKDYFPRRNHYPWFIAAFILIELCSVSLLLHMREARYYSLMIFIVACFFYVFISHFMHRKYSVKRYALLMTLVLFVSYQINIATFISCCITMCIYEAIGRVVDLSSLMKSKKRSFADVWRELKPGLLNLSPVLICGVLIIPFVIFFETFAIAARAAEHYGYGYAMFIEHLKRVYFVFSTQEFLYLGLVVKAIQVIVWFRKYGQQKRNKRREPNYLRMEKLSLFMTIFFICFCVIISRMPIIVIWTRYFIVLQPILILILLLDSAAVFKYFSENENVRSKSFLRSSFSVLLIIGFVMNLQGKRITHIKDYVYQITHQLKGPLDFLILYIRENYDKPENIILATNYEEDSYVYYLGCKVILGYANKEYEEAMKLQPDVIIFRKRWGHDPGPYNQLIQRGKYNRVSFPVYDSNVNNIAELDFVIQHQYETKLGFNEQEKSDILMRVK